MAEIEKSRELLLDRGIYPLTNRAMLAEIREVRADISLISVGFLGVHLTDTDKVLPLVKKVQALGENLQALDLAIYAKPLLKRRSGSEFQKSLADCKVSSRASDFF